MTAPECLNRLKIEGVLQSKKALRYTPAGVPVSEAIVQHSSMQLENAFPRQVEFDLSVLALGTLAQHLDATILGSLVRLDGFFAEKSRHGKALVLHINLIEILEGK